MYVTSKYEIDSLTIPDDRVNVCVLVAEPAVDNNDSGYVRVEVRVMNRSSIVHEQSLGRGWVTPEI